MSSGPGLGPSYIFLYPVLEIGYYTNIKSFNEKFIGEFKILCS